MDWFVPVPEKVAQVDAGTVYSSNSSLALVLETAIKYFQHGCSTRTVRDDIKAAREMIADEMRRQDAEVTAKLAGGRRMGYLKSQAGYLS